MRNETKQSSIAVNIIALISGSLFATGLVVSGMVNPQKVLNFLDVAGNWDPSLAFVMAGALAVFGIGYAFVVKKQKTPVCNSEFHILTNKVIDKKLVSGALLFGIGWGLVGLCPGPVLANFSLMQINIIAFIVAMIVGLKLAQWFEKKRE